MILFCTTNITLNYKYECVNPNASDYNILQRDVVSFLLPISRRPPYHVYCTENNNNPGVLVHTHTACGYNVRRNK